MKTRCAIYVYWDKEGVLRSFAEYLIEQLMQECETVLVVINGTLQEVYIESLEKLGCLYLIRDNIGYDFGAYRAGILFLGWNFLYELDELILVNSSVYGPLISLKNILGGIDSSYDFAGITRWRGEKWPEHLQSYFLIFRKRVINSSSFKVYWEKLKLPADRRDTIQNCETQLTSKFVAYGFQYGVYFNVAQKGDPTMEHVALNISQGLPFLKRKYFSDFSAPIDEKIGITQQLKEYPLNLIYQDVFREYCNLVSDNKSFIIRLKQFIKSIFWFRS